METKSLAPLMLVIGIHFEKIWLARKVLGKPNSRTATSVLLLPAKSLDTTPIS